MPGTSITTQTATALLSQLTSAGLSARDAQMIAGRYIIEQAGIERRTFSYSAAFAGAAGACAATFVRTFQHNDWIDGESVVQAGETAAEDGFNKRLHAIEADLDGLSTDVKRAFTCLADMRTSLHTLLDEIKLELNRLNADVYECCSTDRIAANVPKLRDDLIEKQPIFMGTAEMLGKHVSIWNTKQGIMMLPAFQSIGVTPSFDPRVAKAATLARAFVENKAIQNMFANGRNATKEDVAKALGDAVAPTGQKFSELVSILPDKSTYANLDQVLTAVIEREAAALRTGGYIDMSIAATFGVGADVADLGSVPIERFEAVPLAQRTELTVRGINTLQKLAAANPRQLSEMLSAAGIATSPGDAAAYTAAAKTIMATR